MMSTVVLDRDDLVQAPFGDELMMMDVEKGLYYGLNETATLIWQTLESPVTVAEICRRLENVFEVTPEACQAEVFRFLNLLDQKGVLEILTDS